MTKDDIAEAMKYLRDEWRPEEYRTPKQMIVVPVAQALRAIFAAMSPRTAYYIEPLSLNAPSGPWANRFMFYDRQTARVMCEFSQPVMMPHDTLAITIIFERQKP